MLAIRMRRLGAKKRPFFRVVVIDSHAARDGRSVEVLGHYNPTSQPETLVIKRDRLAHWLSKGAQPSDTVRTLLGRHPEGEETEPAAETAVASAATPAEAAPVEAPPVEVAAEDPVVETPPVEAAVEVPAPVADPEPDTEKDPTS
jgi:small subunit ribosomal protein S16